MHPTMLHHAHHFQWQCHMLLLPFSVLVCLRNTHLHSRPANDPATLDAAPLAPRPRPCTFAFQRASKRAEPRATQQTPWW
uniref:Secreted protein n=1 Tax=Caenorhabditis japonica TaxID=281687 RepID=A0A8R1HKY3_CAEJA